jgi:hypothetical protein
MSTEFQTGGKYGVPNRGKHIVVPREQLGMLGVQHCMQAFNDNDTDLGRYGEHKIYFCPQDDESISTYPLDGGSIV